MSFVQIFVHVVWSTKHREPTLRREKREILFKHIHQNAREKGIHLDTIGGHLDHVHCLLGLDKEQAISKVIQLIKGESAHWANKEGLIRPYLQWQEEYYAGSIDYKSLQVVRNYILEQEEHHKKKTFEGEYQEFLIMCGVQRGESPQL
jgi:putative transposase